MVVVDYRTGIDYTTFTKYDVGSSFTVGGPEYVYGGVNRLSAARLVQDEGAEVITSAYLRQKVVISAVNASSQAPCICLFSVQTVNQHGYGPSGKKASLFILNHADDVQFKFHLRASIGVTDVGETSPVWRTAPQTYYIHVEAHDASHTITVQIYSDDQYSNLVESLTLTDGTWMDGPWRYFMPLNNAASGAPGASTTFELRGNTTEYAGLAAGFNVKPAHGEVELASKFFVTRYRTPSQIKTEADGPLWGAILCIDPNGLRADQKGPIYYLLDGCTIRPGLTDKAGGFVATINDNLPSIDSVGNRKRIYDMTLFEADSIYIRDNDEFWVGVQQGVIGSSGPVLDNSIGRENSWAAGTGGRQWFLGGWITKRYYNYDALTRITATIEGKCYMDLWKENHFGTEDIPRDYTDAETIDILQVVVDILHDINIIQDDDYGFRSHPSNFPGSPLTADVIFAAATIPVQDTDSFSPGSAFIWDNDIRAGETVTITVVNPTSLTIAPGLTTGVGFSVGENAWIAMTADLTGTPFLREFNNHPCLTSMRDLCERADFEWKITPYPAGTTPAERRRLEFYPRATAPVSGAEHILYGDSIRDLPSIMVGNTTNLVTNALITGKPVTLPDPDGTWTDSGAWLAKSSRAEIYHRASIPPPPNASYPPYARASYADSSLILDDEGYPGLNFQKDDGSVFDMYLSFYAEGGDLAVAKLDLDLRKWRRLKLRFRHATAQSATITLTVNNYANLVGKTIVVTATSVADEAIPRVEYLIEGIDWFAATSDGATATSIRDAINALAWADASVLGSVVTAIGSVTGFLSYIASDAASADLNINVSTANIYRISLHTFNSLYAWGSNAWNQKFFYDFGTGVKQSSTVFNDPVLSNHDIVTQRLWSEIDILLPDINPDGTIGDGTLASLSDDTYMHGWRAVHLFGPPVTPDTTADPTNIDFVAMYVNCKERGPGGANMDAPGWVSRSLSGTNKNFVAALQLGAAASAGQVFINVINAHKMAGDYAFAPAASEARSFAHPYPRYVLWRNAANWEEIKVAGVATSGSLYPGNNNVYLATPLQNNYISATVLLRGGWNFSFGRFHFTPGSINKDGGAAAHLANPKRFRLISSDDVEYAVDVEGLADQTLLDAVSLQAVKLTLDGDPRRLIGTRVRPYLDEARFAAGLPTTFHGESMIIDIAEHHVVDVDFYSVFLVSPLGTRARERLMAMIQGTQESKLRQTSYGTRFRGKFQPK